MGSGPKSLRSFHIHGKKHEFRDVPKGCLAIKVGQGEDDLQRFVVPLIYINHPLFFAALEDPSLGVRKAVDDPGMKSVGIDLEGSSVNC
ncbi:hypothetical protein K1719_013458 [Acacia pycnantha]|nr:hypothetical protein K1719_013458 [Acacia pycnantha]